ncbi:GNAT family N-acetyltransferase [Flavobacterium sp. NRK1]|uniref:GNAT family N-acetyltransferase n=1 Tax=Flavobacterium sp. NRK1 TaxID=2954929 RepID=UPI00209257D0|nr:GNAT family N-acetyltransferase [Flavobacterium sp. NRK1]MCO6148844.1 GNAT family N-acetyltransferase [Flavobacterium sp. NRK1]
MTIEPCNKENIKKIVDGINNYNLNKVAALADNWTSLEYVAKDDNGTEIGGILADIGYWNGLEIKILWVKEECMNKGIGYQLLKYTETIAAQRRATIAMLDTFDFQAEDFYLKNGYTPIGTIENFPAGHKRIYFSKILNIEKE